MRADAGSLDTLLAASPSLAARLAGARRAAASQSPILILGEPGTGRSALARALHRASARAGGPLIEVDAGLLPSSLLESELFGYRAGAFTGAEEAMEGRVERAEGGTLVLDHVEALPLASQPKLLRLLAESRYAPLGGHERPADVRFVAIAAEDLEQRVASGVFRRDLYFRLEVLAFHVPALRQRPEDLPSLAEALLGDLARRFGRARPRLSPRALAWMADYPWPGNLRELRNLLERALITAGERVEVLDPRPPRGALASLGLAAPGGVPPSLAEVEQAHIRIMLGYTRGHQGRAASLLGISRKALWQKRKRYGIP